MSSHDIHSIVNIQHIFLIVLIQVNGVDVGNSKVIDTRFLLSTEFTFTSLNESGYGSFAFRLREGDTDVYAEHTLVADKDLLGDNMVINGVSQIFNQGYIGKKRFLSAEVDATGVTAGRRVGTIMMANTPRRAPININ